MSLSFFESTHRMIPGVYINVRSTLIATAKGSVLISPIQFTPQQLSDIREQGEVIAIIEPNAFHNMWAKEARAQFPRAELWAVPGFEKRNATLNPEKILIRDEWPFENEIALQLLEGAEKINEVVFLHKPTRSLIVTDLAFNMKNPKGWLTPLLFRVMGHYRKFAVPDLWKRMTNDKPRFKKSLERILTWDFDRLVMAHGSIIEGGGKAKLKAALEKQNLI